jgi:glycosyltransferase involved in cell wall biosynthesis
MNILFHCWEYPPRGSGIGRYVYYMSKALRDAGHTTVIVTSAGDGLPEQEEMDNGIIYRAYDYADIGKSAVADTLADVCRRHSIDIVEGVDHLGETTGFLERTGRPPVMVKCHYSDAVRSVRYAQGAYFCQKLTINVACLRDSDRIRRERRSIRNADILCACSRKLADNIRDEGLCGEKDIGVLSNPIEVPGDWESDEGPTPIVLLVGRVDFGKGIQYLPRILGRLVEAYPDAMLEIAGGDSYARGIGSTEKWLRRKLGDLISKARFLSHIGPGQLDKAYQRAWVVIVPSRWDTFPTSVLEAMARKKAVIGSPNGGIPEMLEGTQCPVADPASEEFDKVLIALISNEESRHNAGLSGHKKAVRKYAPEVMAERYLKYVESKL